MDWFRWFKRKNELTQEDNSVSPRDLLEFMQRQQEQNNQIIKAVLEHSATNARTLENYIELFKPKQVSSTTLEERERLKSERVEPRESEWEGVKSLEDGQKN